MSNYGEPPQGPQGQDPYGQPAYGTPPPGSGQGPYGTPGDRPYSVGDAFGYGWKKFQENLGPILLAVLGILVVTIVVQVIGSVVSGALTSAGSATVEFNPETGEFEGGATSGGLFGAAMFVSLGFGILTSLMSMVVQAGIVKGSLEITRGRKVDLKEMFAGIDFVQVLIAALITSVLIAVGIVLCVLPGLVAAFFTWFTLYFLIDRQLSAIDAIKASASFAAQHSGSLILFFLASVLAWIIGAALCGLGLLVAIPVVIVAQAYTFRTLQGETVAP